MFPRHALHEKDLQRQKGVVPLFGSQEQGYGRCGGSRYLCTRCGGSRIGMSRVSSPELLWREPHRNVQGVLS